MHIHILSYVVHVEWKEDSSHVTIYVHNIYYIPPILSYVVHVEWKEDSSHVSIYVHNIYYIPSDSC